MADIQIQISVDTNTRSFTYQPSTTRAKPGQTIQWTSSQGAFALAFIEQTPFQSIDLYSAPNDDSHATGENAVRADARGHHHYGSSIVVDGQIFVDVGCPDIVIDP